MNGTLRVTKEELHLLGSKIDGFVLRSVPFESICIRISSNLPSVRKLKAEWAALACGGLLGEWQFQDLRRLFDGTE